MATINHILIISVLFLVIIAITTNLVVASSSSSSSGLPSSIEIEIAPNDNEPNAAAASGTDRIRMIRPTFPDHWGPPPKIQTRDYVQLPGDYGRGSGTLRNWILKKMEEDEQQGVAASSQAEASSSGALEDEAENRSSSPAWQEKDMVGWVGEDAKAVVLAEEPFLHVMIVPENSMLTMDYREDRVRILVDENGKVSRQPRIG